MGAILSFFVPPPQQSNWEAELTSERCNESIHVFERVYAMPAFTEHCNLLRFAAVTDLTGRTVEERAMRWARQLERIPAGSHRAGQEIDNPGYCQINEARKLVKRFLMLLTECHQDCPYQQNQPDDPNDRHHGRITRYDFQQFVTNHGGGKQEFMSFFLITLLYYDRANALYHMGQHWYAAEHKHQNPPVVPDAWVEHNQTDRGLGEDSTINKRFLWLVQTHRPFFSEHQDLLQEIEGLLQPYPVPTTPRNAASGIAGCIYQYMCHGLRAKDPLCTTIVAALSALLVAAISPLIGKLYALW